MVSHAFDLMEKGKIDKLIWVRNTVGVKDAKEVGYLPGTLQDKLWPYCQILSDILGSEFALQDAISRGKVELQALNFIRGRSYKNAIIYCSEAENLTKEHVQLLISRCDEGTQLWMNGDYKHQVDDKVFETNNGLKESIECLKGNRMFGVVELQRIERNKVAGLADLLD